MTEPATVGEALSDRAFAAAWAAGRRTPELLTSNAARVAADLAWRRRGRGVQQLEANLRRAMTDAAPDQVRAMSRRAMRSYFRYWREVFALPSWSHRRILDSVVLQHFGPLDEGFSRGEGAVIALSHSANWDLAGAYSCLYGFPVSTVAERLRPESLFRRFVGYRERLGMEVVPLSGADNPMTAMVSAVRRGRLVCLLADRNMGAGGIEVEFLGETARVPAGAAMLARMTGAPLFAMNLVYLGPLLRMEFSDPIAARPGRDGLRQMMQDVADYLGAGIRRRPWDWHMLQPVFAADVEPDHGSSS